ncbi:hypothetical protein EI94DRAFT_1799863 [Lactarius quietus]|nr:hypothetical protein EI94DRAFT_1799863 [Lactarius quietus]
MALKGLPLLDDLHSGVAMPTPAELVETILHSMIGHLNLFLGSVLHRDISSGNILRHRDPIEWSLGHSEAILCDTPLGQGVTSLQRRRLLDVSLK